MANNKFYNELNVLRKRLEFKERIVYNKGDESQPLDEPAWQKLYDFIGERALEGSVYHYNCGFGIHLVNLNILGHTCYGSVINMQWEQEGHKWLSVRDHANIFEVL